MISASALGTSLGTVFPRRSVAPTCCSGRASRPASSGLHYEHYHQHSIQKAFYKHETYRNQPDTCLVTEPIHLPLLLPISQTILILHGNELSPTVLLGTELHHRELIGSHRAGSDVANFAASNQIM